MVIAVAIVSDRCGAAAGSEPGPRLFRGIGGALTWTSPSKHTSIGCVDIGELSRGVRVGTEAPGCRRLAYVAGGAQGGAGNGQKCGMQI